MAGHSLRCNVESLKGVLRLQNRVWPLNPYRLAGVARPLNAGWHQQRERSAVNKHNASELHRRLPAKR